MMRLSRREFTWSALAAGTAAATHASGSILSANDRLQVGFIGVGNRGRQVLDAFREVPGVAITALCDVYEPYLDAANKLLGGSVATFKDYRKLLESKDVNAVVIATPDHWHALQFIDACNAGKDIYVEKPLSLTVVEGRKMVEAAQRTNRITQMGVQRRSCPMIRHGCELVRSGGIGKVTVAKCYHLQNETPMGIGKPEPCDPPPGLDWDMWLGPAPKVPYVPNKCLYRFRWFYNYSGGQLTNFGTHYIDQIQWGLGQDAPEAVMAMGGKFAVDDNREIPDTLEVVWRYDGAIVTFSQYNANNARGNPRGADVEFRGTKGTLYQTYGEFVVEPQSVRQEPLSARDPLRREENSREWGNVKKAMEPIRQPGQIRDVDHARNFVECVKTRKPCNCPVEVGHRSTTATLIGNIALKRQRLLEWDARAERFTNDDEANKLLFYEYRAPWKLT
jgi:predicted dehydrogenase